MTIDLNGRVAIVTGAGGGLGRCHALALARRGARVVVNDLGGARDGTGGSATAAERVVEEIRAAGGEAMANAASVTDYAQVEAMAAEVLARWGRVDILVNNAGILRDKTFAKVDLADFRAVLDVHLMGSVNCTRAVWNQMREQNYGRVVFTASSTGLYGNFGQSAYGTAKLALVGLMNTLREEGRRNNIRVNCLSPNAASRMTADVMDEETLAALDPAKVSHAVVALACEEAPDGVILGAGAGSFERAYVTLTQGAFLGHDEGTADRIIEQWDRISDREGEMIPATGFDQARYEVSRAKANQ